MSSLDAALLSTNYNWKWSPWVYVVRYLHRVFFVQQMVLSSITR